MDTRNKSFGRALVAMLGLAFAGIACATPVTMDFDDFAVVPHDELVANYYNGGCSKTNVFPQPATCGGPDYGVVWTGAIAGYSNRILGARPSNPNTMSISRRGYAVMNVADGFGSSLAFYYFAKTPGRNTGSVTIYSGADGAGDTLATLTLPATGCGRYVRPGCWASIDMTFEGVAHSAVFDQTRRVFLGFDNVSLAVGASDVAVPEPSALGMYGLGALLIVLFAYRPRRNFLHDLQ